MSYFEDEVAATDAVVAEAPAEETVTADGVESDATEEAQEEAQVEAPVDTDVQVDPFTPA